MSTPSFPIEKLELTVKPTAFTCTCVEDVNIIGIGDTETLAITDFLKKYIAAHQINVPISYHADCNYSINDRAKINDLIASNIKAIRKKK